MNISNVLHDLQDKNISSASMYLEKTTQSIGI